VCTSSRSVISSRLTAGNFPDYRKILPKQFTTECVILKEDFIVALKKAVVVSDVSKQVRLSVSSKTKTISITSKNTVMGEMKEDIDGTIEGDDIELHFNHKYIFDCVQSIPVDSLKLSFSGQSKPVVIQGISDGTFLYLVMPMNK
jgi:DNA polymerase-3 subunit beta